MAGEELLLEGWQVLKLSDLGKIVTGKTPSTKFADYFGDDIPFITPSDMDGRRIIDKTGRCLTNKGAETVTSAKIPAGTVMVSCIGSNMGKTAIAGCDAITNQQINSIIVHDSFSNLFVYYNLSTRKTEFQHLASGGSALPILNKGQFSELLIKLPSLRKEQEAIGCILGALDDKIELNQKMNQTLEATAQAIFKSWFVDFDPVHAKVEGRDPGLPKTIADLFPAEFEDSELGKIPRGWEVRKLRDCCERVENGGTPRRSEPRYWEPAIVPWLTSGEVRQDIVTKTNNMISKEGLANSSAKLWPAATTVVALYGATAGQVCFLGDSMCANQACCGLIPKKNMRYFVYLHLASSVASLEQQARGSAQQNLSQQIVADLPVMIPSSETLEKFDECLHPPFSKWIANIEASRTLAALRDMLLPKLLSGEISIANTERFIRRYI
jgi:type I restriction enzyme S subunit